MKSQISSGKPKKLKTNWPLIIRKIHGHSMMPVLPPRTYIWATGWFGRLKPGDVIVFLHDSKEKIKRISDMRENELFLLGDHAEASTDSRHFGWLAKDAVIAKVVWPRAPQARAEGFQADSDQTSPDR